MAGQEYASRRRIASPLRRLLGAAGLLLASLSPAVAQPGETKVETYSGLRRMDRPAARSGPMSRVTDLAPPEAKPLPQLLSTDSRPSSFSAASKSNGSPSVVTLPPEPPPVLRHVEETKPIFRMPAAAELPAFVMSAQEPLPVLRPTNPSVVEIEPIKPASRGADRTVVKASVTSAETQAPLAEPASEADHAAKPPHKAEAPDEGIHIEGIELSQNDLYRIALWQMICTLCALGLGVVILAGLALIVVRRITSGGGPLVRVEFAQPFMMPMGNVPAGAALPVAPVPVDQAPSTAQPFDIGPTYEEELRLKGEAEAQQQQAVLRQILEDNVKLREALQAGGAAAGES